MGMGGAYQDAYEKERKRKADAKAEALAAEETAVYNLREIRKLEKRVADSDTEAIGWIEAQQAVNGAMRGDIIRLMEHCTELQGEVTGLGEAYNAQAEELGAQARKLEASQELEKRVEMLERELEEQFRPGCSDLTASVGAISASIGILSEQQQGDVERVARLAVHTLQTVGLVERMGRAVDTLTEWYCNDGPLLLGGHIDTTYPFTVAGERERRAAMHDAEGPPPTRESTGAWGHE